MQPDLKNTARNLEAIFVQTVNPSELCYSPLFETFRNEILLLETETRAVTNASLNNLLTFSKLNEIPRHDLAKFSATPQRTSEDKLFLFNFDFDYTEKQEDINLAGIDQLPNKQMTRYRACSARGRGKPEPQPKFTPTRKRQTVWMFP